MVHIAQQAILSLKMTRQELNDYVVKNRISLEEDANEIASKLVFSKKRKSLLNLFFDKTKCKSINLCNSMDVPCQYWMVDGPLAVLGAGEVNCTSEIENRKNTINNIIQENSANETMIDHLKANDWMDLQASAKSDGIHETYTKDAYNNLFHYLKETYKIDNRQIRIKKTSKKNIEIHVISTENVLPKIVTRKIVYDEFDDFKKETRGKPVFQVIQKKTGKKYFVGWNFVLMYSIT